MRSVSNGFGRSLGLHLVLGITLAGGCDSPPSQNPDLTLVPDAAADGGGEPDMGGSDGGLFERAAGLIEVSEVTTPFGGGRQTGEVRAAFYKEPEVIFQKEILRQGDCRLLSFKPAFCDKCLQGVCVDTNVCKPFPSRISGGTVTISGLKIPVVLMPRDLNYYYLDGLPPMDLYDPLANVSVETSGAAFPAIKTRTQGVFPIEVTSLVNNEVRLSNDADYRFTWTPAKNAGARVRLTLNANNRGHGMPYSGLIQCDAPDTGEIVIAKQLIQGFPDTFRWEVCAGSDCPLSTVSRYNRASVSVPGGLVGSFEVASRREFWVIHSAPK